MDEYTNDWGDSLEDIQNEIASSYEEEDDNE